MLAKAAIAAILLGLLPPAPARAADRYFTTSDGVRLHYTEDGAGRTMVLIPGWTMPAWIWSRQIAEFSRRYRVIAFDPRSQGDSAMANSGHEPVRRGQDIAELIDRLGPDPVLLVGWSLGVMDSLAYVHAHGDSHLAGLVLVDNSVGEDPPPSPSHQVVRPGPPLSRIARMRAFVRGMFARPQPQAWLDRLTAACLRTPPAAAAALLAYPVPRSFWKEGIDATARPVLYVVRPTLAGQAANLTLHHPGAETLVMQGVGHALFVDAAARFDAVMQDFITRRIWH
jgi:non-heme chloroperoxidase